MNSLLVAQMSDLHYCGRYLEWVDRAFSFAINDAIERKANVAIISGDSFDSAINLHEPAVDAYFRRIRELSMAMPLAVLAGTQSHDRPGSLTPLRTIGGRHPVLVADRIGQASWDGERWIESDGWTFKTIPPRTQLLVSFLPSVNRANVAAHIGAEHASEQTGEQIYALCKGWSVPNLAARAAGIPTVLVTHGTVNGSVTECAHALVSPDHEFTSGTLFAAEASAVCIGHIHAHQVFEKDGRLIAYPGSITRLIHGHEADTGYLVWDVQPDGASLEFVRTPSKELLEIDFHGVPDMEKLRDLAKRATGAYVRIRFSVDEDHRASVDRKAIAALFAGAAAVKIEGRINPVQRTRAAGIGSAHSLAQRLQQWCEITQSEPAPLVDRLAEIEVRDVAEIVKELP